LALDLAASEFFRQGKYQFEGQVLSAGEMVDIYAAWLEEYPLISLEDGLVSSSEAYSRKSKPGNKRIN